MNVLLAALREAYRQSTLTMYRRLREVGRRLNPDADRRRWCAQYWAIVGERRQRIRGHRRRHGDWFIQACMMRIRDQPASRRNPKRADTYHFRALAAEWDESKEVIAKAWAKRSRRLDAVPDGPNGRVLFEIGIRYGKGRPRRRKSRKA